MNKTIIIYTICVVFVAAVSASTNFFADILSDDTSDSLKKCFKEKVGDHLADACVEMGYHHWNATGDNPQPTKEFCCGTWFSFLCEHEMVLLYCDKKEMEEFLEVYGRATKNYNENYCKDFQFKNTLPQICRSQA